MARGAPQLPKKKLSNRPRIAPVSALSEADREFFADEADAKSRLHLHEAVAIATWGGAPNAAIHSAYYAMHFCAVAALYRAGGVGKRKDVPQSHEHVLLHYIKLSETTDDPFIRESGRLLNRARDDRVRADYFAGAGPASVVDPTGATAAEAVDAAEMASRFLAAWQAYTKQA